MFPHRGVATFIAHSGRPFKLVCQRRRYFPAIAQYIHHALAMALPAKLLAGDAAFSSCVDAFKAALYLLFSGFFQGMARLLAACVMLPDMLFRDWSCLGSSEGCMRTTAVAIMGGSSVSWSVPKALFLVTTVITVALSLAYMSRQAGPTVVPSAQVRG
jgi:hypothetical protein